MRSEQPPSTDRDKPLVLKFTSSNSTLVSEPSSSQGAKDSPYFSYYSMLTHQQNMLQDSVRTSAYYEAILSNAAHFQGKIVLDLGAGSGILSWFALLAGASHVYCVEAAAGMIPVLSSMAAAQGWSQRVTILHGKVEDMSREAVAHPSVDILISEPMGVLLLHERMIESYLYARDLFLSPQPISKFQMFPNAGSIYLAPFSDASLFHETMNKVRFWQQKDFYHLDLSCLSRMALEHYMSQPVIDSFSRQCLMTHHPICHVIDFTTATKESLLSFSIPLDWTVDVTGLVHGLAGWFDVSLAGPSNPTLLLSSGPEGPRTHWHQLRFLLPHPIAANQGDRLTGTLFWTVNAERSYDLGLTLGLHGNNNTLVKQGYRLHEQQYPYFSSSAQSVQHAQSEWSKPSQAVHAHYANTSATTSATASATTSANFDTLHQHQHHQEQDRHPLPRLTPLDSFQAAAFGLYQKWE